MSETTTPAGGWPQPDGTMLALLQAAILKTATRYPWADALREPLSTMPDTIKRQLDADLCDVMGQALATAPGRAVAL